MKEFLKKYSIYLVVLLIAIIATISTSISLYGTDIAKYKIELDNNEEIDGILLNDNTLDLSKYSNECIIIEKNLKSKCDTFIEFITSNIDSVKILTKSDINVIRNGKVSVVKNEYNYSSSKINTIKESINLFSLLLLAIYIVLFYFIIELFNKTIEKINNKPNVLDIVLFFICNFAIILSTIYLLLYLFKTLALIPIVGYLLFILKKLKNKEMQNIYLVFSVIIGLTYVFLIPPFNVPDEAAHFMKSYNMLEKTYKTDNGVASLNKDTYDFVTYYEFTTLDSNEKFNGVNYLSNVFKDDLSTVKVNKDYKNTKNASIVPYLPSSIAIKIGKLFGLSTLMLLVLARSINLLIATILGFYAIKNIPKYKKIFLIVMLLPCFIQASMGINMDYLTNALAVFTISYILKIKEKNIDVKQIIILFALGLLIAYSKFGFFPIMLLVLLIPNKKFKLKINPLIIKIILILFVFLLSYKNNSGAITSTADTIESPYYTISYILENPVNTVKIFVKTALNRLDTDIFKGQFDSYGTYSKYTNGLFVTLLIIMYAFILLVKEDNKKTEIKDRIIFILISLMLIGIPYLTMFLCWTKVGADVIDGLQPRYFLVATLMLFMGLSNNIIDLKIKDKNKLYTTCIVISFIISLFTILNGFY